jgi:hypothetical protein
MKSNHIAALYERKLSLSEVLRGLRTLVPEIGEALARFIDQPVSAYAAFLYSPVRRPQGRIVRQSRQLVFDCLRDQLVGKMDEREVGDLVAELDKHGVVQAGPHCELLLSSGPFFTAAFSRMGLKAHGLKHYVTYQCTTNKFQTHPGFGAGWVRTSHGPINVFGLSSTVIKRSSVVAIEGRFRFLFRSRLALPPALEHQLEYYRQLFRYVDARRAADAIAAANEILWRVFTDDETSTFVSLDDRFFARIVMRQLGDESSILTRLLFDESRRSRMQRAVTEFATRQGGGMVPLGTDFFWRVRDGRIRALRLEDGWLSECDPAAEFRLKFRPATIVQALKTEAILPNLFLTYLAGLILPGFRALGGLFQVAYMPAFRQALLASLEMIDIDEAALATDVRAYDGHGLGMGMLRDTPNVLELLADGAQRGIFESIESQSANLTINASTRALMGLRWHKYWGPVFDGLSDEPRVVCV